MRIRTPRLLGLLLAAAIAAGIAAPTRAGVLPITPVVQETQVWCWVAVGEMIFKYLGMPNLNGRGIYQCGVIGALAADQYGMSHPCATDCTRCVVPAGEERWVRLMLERYPAVVAAVGQPARQLVAGYDARILSPEEVVAEIDGGYPMIAGITPWGLPTGVSAHVALIVGYERDQSGQLWLRVNDPYPFNYTGQNPYVTAGAREDATGGAYWILYNSFASGLRWADTFRIRLR